MAIGRLGMNSIMIFCGDRQQIDLRKKEDSAYYAVERIINSPHVFRTVLQENHRHPAVKDILKLLEQ